MLLEPVTVLNGIGEKVAQELELLNIHTIQDLLCYFPYRYDSHEIKPLKELVHEDKVTIEGRVLYEPSLNFYGKKKNRLTFTIEVEMVAVKVVMFNRAFLKKQINPGDIVTLTGKWDAHRLQITASFFKKGTIDQTQEIQPVYGLKGNMTNQRLKKLIQTGFDQYGQQIEEILPEQTLKAYKLPNRFDAIQTMHFPKSHVSLKHARRRIIYEEFLIFQLKMQLLRKERRRESEGNVQKFDLKTINCFIKTFPFTLTDAQQKVLKEILYDMGSPYRMNRLLQGDVGSGKTAVAAISLYGTVTAGHQGALMVPTEILAEQHLASMNELFQGKVTIELLTGSIKGKKRRELLNRLANKEIDILVGTHALIQDDVFFASLGLVVVDEQHRFGVEQRRVLRDKGLHPDVLFMTATPIPRTLAITALGDMDVSVIDKLPAGRKEIQTYWTKANQFPHVLNFVGERILQGEQAYIVCPLIEESDKLDIQNAVDLHQQLKSFYPETIQVGLMHGRRTVEEKEEIMNQFQNNEIQILVSTTVIEVGVNVPNATIMVIYDAERFGLSQLHQLRGRVGRGEKQSHCILIADPKGEVGKERMRIMTETNDGFVLADEDLKLRGPGDFFGRKQSGLPEFKVADMVHDYRALETARKDAVDIIEADLLEKDTAYLALRKEIENKGGLEYKLD